MEKKCLGLPCGLFSSPDALSGYGGFVLISVGRLFRFSFFFCERLFVQIYVA